jgi:hypothetical protein
MSRRHPEGVVHLPRCQQWLQRFRGALHLLWCEPPLPGQSCCAGACRHGAAITIRQAAPNLLTARTCSMGVMVASDASSPLQTIPLLAIAFSMAPALSQRCPLILSMLAFSASQTTLHRPVSPPLMHMLQPLGVTPVARQSLQQMHASRCQQRIASALWPQAVLPLNAASTSSVTRPVTTQ